MNKAQLRFCGSAILGLALLGAAGPSLAAAVQTQPAPPVSDVATQTNRALALQRAGDFHKAVVLYAALESAAKAQQKALPSAVLANYARALVSVGEFEQAAVKMRAASTADPRNASFQDNLGSIYAQQRRWSEAQTYFSAAVRLDPSLAVAHYHLGLALQAQADPAALQEFAQAAKLRPQDNAVALEYGKALAASGDDVKAATVFQAILARNRAPSNSVQIDTTYALALSLQRTGKMSESIPLLRKVLVKQPDNPSALINLGMALSHTQQAALALPVLQRAVVLAPGDVTAHQNLAAALMQLNQFEDAIAEVRAALKLAPDSPQLLYNLGFAYRMQDNAADAIPQLEAAQRLDPQQPEAPYLLGVLYMQTGRYEDAARELKIALTLRPENGDGWAKLGSVYSNLDRLPEATTALEEAIRQLPQQPDPHLTLAAVLAKEKKSAEAMEQRRQASVLMKQNMNRQRAEVATHSGESEFKSGDMAAAAVQFKDALSYDTDYAGAHLGLAKIYEKQGKKAEAAAERQKAAAAPKQ